MLDRCERCGANLALVGRVHRCVTKMPEPVTKNVTRKRGRPPLGERAMDGCGAAAAMLKGAVVR